MGVREMLEHEFIIINFINKNILLMSRLKITSDVIMKHICVKVGWLPDMGKCQVVIKPGSLPALDH